MGRYYSGDIEGKFWFGVQSSVDASFFGGEELDPSFISYYFDEDDIPKITEGLAKCKEHLGEHTDKLDSYYEKRGGYNYHALSEAIGVPEEGLHDLLVWYARLELGRKIHECVKNSGSCSFEADL